MALCSAQTGLKLNTGIIGMHQHSSRKFLWLDLLYTVWQFRFLLFVLLNWLRENMADMDNQNSLQIQKQGLGVFLFPMSLWLYFCVYYGQRCFLKAWHYKIKESCCKWRLYSCLSLTFGYNQTKHAVLGTRTITSKK